MAPCKAAWLNTYLIIIAVQCLLRIFNKAVEQIDIFDACQRKPLVKEFALSFYAGCHTSFLAGTQEDMGFTNLGKPFALLLVIIQEASAVTVIHMSDLKPSSLLIVDARNFSERKFSRCGLSSV
jgi:hypothetical protein